MTTINATKGEFVNLINGLFQVQELKGKKFGLVVSKNITILKKSLKHLEDLGKPSEEFMKLAMEVNEISTKDPENSKEKIDKLEKENDLLHKHIKLLKELLEEREDTIKKLREELGRSPKTKWVENDG